MTCGWPSKGALGKKKRRIGECWDDKASTDRHFEIFISPCLDNPFKVLGVAVHEVVHAVVGLKAGHRKAFGDCATKVGLTKPWTATGESPDLLKIIEEWIKQIGPYPHGALRDKAVDAEKEKGRMLLLECECGLKIRSTQKWLDTYGASWPCPCGSRLVNKENDDGDE